VVVLSNNDGCTIARSNEVKALGVKMGMPWFQMEELARQHSIVALSSNYALYVEPCRVHPALKLSQRAVHASFGRFRVHPPNHNRVSAHGKE